MNAPAAYSPVIPKAISDSIMETFKVQVSESAKILSISAEEPTTSSDIDLISVIGLKSSEYAGSLALGFPSKTFIGVVNKLLGETYTEINSSNVDAAGELLNIIYASARTRINQEGNDFQPAIPTIIRGQELRLAIGTTTKIMKFYCECAFGKFVAALSLKKIK